jgi:spore maturation protein CgeB
VKILLTLNKTYRGQIDGGYWYVYLPLQKLGHEVYLYDTVNPAEKNFKKVVDNFKPDLIFCCFTGDKNITPYEPWEDIARETQSGRTKTFNWYCDDQWRFDNFSRVTCWNFNCVSTPDPNYISEYKKIGYSNILEGIWHANADLYPLIQFDKKDIPLSFMGAVTPSRQTFFNLCDLPIQTASNLTHDQMMSFFSRSQIGINLSKNDNDVLKKTQIKQRIFEITAGQSMLFTEYHKGIEKYYTVDREIVTFQTIEECRLKGEFLLKNPQIVKRIAEAGYVRFCREHESSKRLSKLLNEIERL